LIAHEMNQQQSLCLMLIFKKEFILSFLENI
jgi:hypothetical protein